MGDIGLGKSKTTIDIQVLHMQRQSFRGRVRDMGLEKFETASVTHARPGH